MLTQALPTYIYIHYYNYIYYHNAYSSIFELYL